MGKRRRKLRGGVASNLDVNLSPQKREEAARDERNMAVFNSVRDSAKEYQFQNKELIDFSNPRSKVSVSDMQLADREGFRRDQREAIIPIGVFPSEVWPKGFDWLLTEADNECIRQGYACPNCLTWFPIPWMVHCRACNHHFRDV